MVLDPNKLAAVRTIVTHDNCADGLAAAMILRAALPKADIEFHQYNTAALAKLEARPGMLFVDFSPPPERAAEFRTAGAILLDHHKTARAVVESFGLDGVFGDEIENPGVCGATLAYTEVYRPIRGVCPDRASLAKLAGIRDTWQRQSPFWSDACEQAEALTFWPREKWLAAAHLPETWSEPLSLGAVLITKRAAEVKEALAKAYRFTLDAPTWHPPPAGGCRVIVFEGLRLTSDAAEAVGQDADLVVGFGYEVDAGSPKVIFSCRSKTGLDCSKLAKSYGGGGHTAAAGFARELTAATAQPYAQIRALVAYYLGVSDG